MKCLEIKLLTILIMTVSLVSCNGGGGGSAGPGNFNADIQGYIQKGPFLTGTSIIIQELGANLVSTGKTHFTETLNDFGEFEIDADLSSDYIEVIAIGYYFNETTGELSESTLTLNAIADLSEDEKINVNLLTTLERERIRYLIKEEGLDYWEARAQAETEILQIFNITDNFRYIFSEMDISKEGDYNAVLLAISVLLQWDSSVAELSKMISDIGLDISEDGVLDNSQYLDKFKENARRIDASEIVENMIDRYDGDVVVPNFEDFIDSDGDGIINRDDPQTIFWAEMADGPPFDGWSWTYTSALVYDEKMWAIIGEEEEHKDIWSSENGRDWSLVSDNTPWGYRYDFGYTVFDNKMWIMGGSDYDINLTSIRLNDVWYSSNGKDWYQATPSANWSPRARLISFAYNNKLWICGGHGSGTEHTEIWNSDDGVDWDLVTDAAPWHIQSAFVFHDKIWIVVDLFPAGNTTIFCSENGADWELVIDDVPWGEDRREPFVVHDDTIWLIGGGYADNEYAGHMWYSADGEIWEEYTGPFPWGDSSDTPSSLQHHELLSFDNRIWVVDASKGVWAFTIPEDYINNF